MSNLFGSAPNQVSTNGDLGTMAFQDHNAVKIVGGTLSNLKEVVYYQECTSDVTIDWANGDVQFLYINPSTSSVQITLPAGPGTASKSMVLFVKNNTSKTHTWNTTPVIRFVSEPLASSVPVQAAAGYWTRYTIQWNYVDSNWWVAVAGRDTV